MTTDRRALREVVDSPGFRGLMAVRLSGQFADGLFQAALFSAVFFNPERATSAGQAAAAFATLLLPYSVVGPFAGVFLDRWRRQRVLVNANLARSSVIVVFAALLMLQGPTAPAVVALALVVVSANRFILSGLSAALPHVVEAKRLVTANSVSSTLGAGAAAAGGAAALGLRAVFGD
ncbi:MAG: major facilitator superfamily 1, partial [Frankiales bacterium]|nr:major facilitator superfamily 1 [Frankiales bacterium]